MNLDRFSNEGFDRGASRFKEALWLAANRLLLSSWIPGSVWRATLLKTFGAEIGTGVVLKPGIRVKFPWRLSVGDHVWIGEDVWIDNLAQVSIGGNSCISQGAYLCTGSHDWSDERFRLIIEPIIINERCWVGARSCLAPGTIMKSGAVLSMNVLGKGTLTKDTIHKNDIEYSTKRRIFRNADETK